MRNLPDEELGGLEPAVNRPRLGAEVLLVLGLSFGQSGIYALLRLIRRLGEPTSLKEQTANLNVSVSEVGWLDIIYQLVGAAFALVPVGLALYLLAIRPAGRSVSRGLPGSRLGLDLTRPLRDLGWGAVLAAGIGIPGIGFYLLGRQM